MKDDLETGTAGPVDTSIAAEARLNGDAPAPKTKASIADAGAAFLATFAQRRRDERLTASCFIGDLSDDFYANRFHFYFSKTGVKGGEEEFANRGRATDGRNIGTQNQSVGGVEVQDVVKLLGIAGERPVLSHLADCNFGSTQRRSGQRSANDPSLPR